MYLFFNKRQIYPKLNLNLFFIYNVINISRIWVFDFTLFQVIKLVSNQDIEYDLYHVINIFLNGFIYKHN